MASRDALGYRHDRGQPKRAARTYVRTFLGLVLPVLGLLAAFSLYQAPVQGDLTRIGGYTENAYGWNAPQKRFIPPLVATKYDRPFDIVVLGDSYSVNPGGQTPHGAFWTNFVAQQTGLSTVALSIHDISMRELLDHPVFKRAPPRAVILQIVERYLVRNLIIQEEEWIGPGFNGCPDPGPPPPVRLSQPLAAVPVPWHRSERLSFDLDRAFDTLWKAGWRAFDVNLTRVHSLGLTSPALFSSRASDRMLIYDDEFRLGDWRREDIERVLCRLRAIQEQVQANGQTAFLLAVPPNKLSVYSDVVAEKRLRGLDNLPAILADRKINQVDLLTPLRDGVRCGLVDVYMPNDTHWGTSGNEIVASATVAALARRQGPPGKRC
jgi:SGNH hydrolase-like domain, acetyltransferase AlgX